MLDPAAVVLDGSLGAAGEPVMAGIREAIDRHAAPAVADSVRVLAGELGDRAELLGAVADQPCRGGAGIAGRRGRGARVADRSR